MRWKAQILAGVTCTFSGVIPNDQDATRSRFWKLATSYGAHCCLDLTGKVTHLIASRTGTTKVNKAKHYQRIHIVSLAWLLESVSQCTMQDETLYPLISSLPASAVVTPVSTPLGDEDELLLLEEKEEGLSENKSKTDKWKQQDMREDGTATETPSVNTSNGTTSNHEDNNNLDLETEFHDIDHIDWDEADKEVNDYMNESGTDDNYSSGPDSPLPIGAVINNNNNNNNNRKRKRPNASSLVFRRAKAAVRGPSRLSNMVRVNDTGTSDEDEENNQETGSQKQHSYKRDDDDDDDDNSSSSSLSSFAGELDDEIE
ncbi:uncharacterized protein BX664DRAFT_41054 [Halteromyces radiatus]|uniref:uncharacterized protein n=1 Tax=Halteromyces radiatus TaxID=101107 RepID=UPI00221FAF7C|nr:uncharacterized protein BX664DRAFT_41054 [Halteromyces radiatus]KAI8078905.1 hypothetical protein BX664DRAFT_41054 [Halteromyces radiatus]